MIFAEIKRVVRFDAMAGKTIEKIDERMGDIRIIFTDGTFADLESEAVSKITVQKHRPRREKREWRERRG